MALTRRDLLILLPAVALADTRPEPHLTFPTNPRDRLAVTSWPFRTYIESPTNHGKSASAPGMDLKGFAGFVVEKFAVHNINPLADHFSSTDDAYIADLREAIHRAGSHIVDLGLAGKDFFTADAATRQSAVDYGRKWIDIAVKVGSPSVRQHLRARRGQRPDPATAAEGLGQLADYGAKRNIVINLENDEAIAEDPFLIVAIIEKAKNPYLRALPDFGNALTAHDQAYSERGVQAMLPHAWNMCHVKDFVKDDKGQIKNVDLAKMFALAKQNSYRGYYSMEFDTEGGDPVTGTQELVKKTLQFLA